MTSVHFARRGAADVDRIDKWWRAHRPGSPTLFTDEVAAAIVLLETAPEIGPRYEGAAGTRRLLLRASQHHLYYEYDAGSATVTILAVWGALRGRGPTLR